MSLAADHLYVTQLSTSYGPARLSELFYTSFYLSPWLSFPAESDIASMATESAFILSIFCLIPGYETLLPFPMSSG